MRPRTAEMKETFPPLFITANAPSVILPSSCRKLSLHESREAMALAGAMTSTSSSWVAREPFESTTHADAEVLGRS